MINNYKKYIKYIKNIHYVYNIVVKKINKCYYDCE